ncbi:MAG: PD-(D/E)XK nuclease family protein [Thioalkalispiraceae bacterium]
MAKLIIQQHSEALPDLSHVHVLLSEPSAAPALRHHLLVEAQQFGFDAILGIQIETLRDWAYQHLPDDMQVCDAKSQELILVEALNQHPALLRSASPWVMAENLLNLFAELTLKHIQLPDSPEDFIAQMQTAYGDSAHQFSALGQEANLIHTLWQAWHTQLKADNLHDTHSAYLHGLANSINGLDRTRYFYLAGYQQFDPAELEWLQQLIKLQRVTLLLQGNAQATGKTCHPDTPLFNIARQLSLPVTRSAQSHCSELLDEVFNSHKAPLLQRAMRIKQLIPQSPLAGRLQVFAAHNAEQEAQAIELQVRRWLKREHEIRSIAIVTENRRLARRVRALLERSQVPLQDAAGWALSTTSAAATVERWLECIEEDFDYLALLDLLKSPFLFPQLEADEFKQAVYRFEQDVIRHENINRGITHYQNALQRRRARLSTQAPTAYLLLESLLEQLAEIAQPLQQLQKTKSKLPAEEFLTTFMHSLTNLGMSETFANDRAGQRLQQAFDELWQATRTTNLLMNWVEFRGWLGRHLERMNFQPHQVNSRVQLMGLSQTCLQQFDALIIASAEQEHLPGRVNSSPFFNDTVRKELALTTSTEQLSERLYHFRRLLESAPEVLITLRAEEHGEPVMPSPWLQAIQAFHQQAYGYELQSAELTAILGQSRSVVEDTLDSLPPLTKQAKPTIVEPDMPDSFSPSAYQKMLDCPYRFFASYVLKLKAPEEVSEALARDEYGNRVHRCLQAFHSPVDGLPGPFSQQLSAEVREQAIQLMNEIAEAVFQQDEQSNFEHHAWHQQWSNIIPHYIDWEIERQQDWQVVKTELLAKNRLDESTFLKGRLDRIDRNTENQLSVIDYKTGQLPNKKDVLAGEYIQLPFYTLLDIEHHQHATDVAYLSLSKSEKLAVKVNLHGEELEQLAQAIALRLTDIVERIREGHALPAWSDSKTCSYCEMDKLCRRQAWQDELYRD